MEFAIFGSEQIRTCAKRELFFEQLRTEDLPLDVIPVDYNPRNYFAMKSYSYLKEQLPDDELLQYYNIRIQDIDSLDYEDYQAVMKEMIDYLDSNKEKLVEKYDVEYFDEIRRKFELESIYGGKADDFNYNASIFNTREKFIFENVKMSLNQMSMM